MKQLRNLLERRHTMSLTLAQMIFDLDDTLYPRRCGIMLEVRQLILDYMTDRLHMPSEEAQALRERYLHEYGTTMAGLLRHHDLDAEDYLEYVHPVNLERCLGPNPALDRALASIDLPKAVWTNATEEHALRVLDILGVARHFSQIIDVRDMDYVSKPSPVVYHKVLRMLDAKASECVLVEDSVRNLRPAKELGMLTVLVDGRADHAADFVIDGVEEIGSLMGTLL